MTKLQEVQAEIGRLKEHLDANQKIRAALEEKWRAAWEELGALSLNESVGLPWVQSQPAEAAVVLPQSSAVLQQHTAADLKPAQLPVGKLPELVQAETQTTTQTPNVSHQVRQLLLQKPRTLEGIFEELKKSNIRFKEDSVQTLISKLRKDGKIKEDNAYLDIRKRTFTATSKLRDSLPKSTSTGKGQIIVNLLEEKFRNIKSPMGLSALDIYAELKTNRAFFETGVSYETAMGRLSTMLYNLYERGQIDRHDRDPDMGIPYRYFVT